MACKPKKMADGGMIGGKLPVRTAMNMGLSIDELRKSFIDAHLGWQNASLNAAQMDLQAKMANSSNDAHLASANISGFAHIMQARATAAAAAAQAAGHQGAAALSSLSSGAHLNVSASQ